MSSSSSLGMRDSMLGRMATTIGPKAALIPRRSFLVQTDVSYRIKERLCLTVFHALAMPY